MLDSRKVLAAVEAADRLGVFEALDGDPLPEDRLIARLAADPSSARVLLRVLGWNGVLDECEEGWRLSNAWAPVLSPSSPHSQLSRLRIEGWAAVDHLNCDGIVAAWRGEIRPPEIADEFVPALAEAMLVGARSSAPHLGRLPEMRGRRNIADVAGGSGGYSVWLCRIDKSRRATVYDRPEMVRHADSVIRDAGLADRVAVREWNLHDGGLPPGHDAAILSHVLHLLPASGRADLLKHIYDALEPKGVLVVQDFVYDDVKSGTRAAASATDWLAYGTGFAPTSQDLADEITSAHFEVVRTLPHAEGSIAFIVGVKP